MLTYANHLGVYAEEIGLTGEQLGNFPKPSPTSPSSVPRSTSTGTSADIAIGIERHVGKDHMGRSRT